MILILLGTQDKPFKRILKQVEKLKKDNIIKDKVIAQIGYTKFQSNYIETFDFIAKEKIEELIDKAKIVITHGGVGIITECLEKNKKLIVVPRLSKHKEHTNDHQLEITKEFANKEYIIPLYDVKKLEDALKQARKFEVKKYVSNNKRFVKQIKKYIDEV